MSDVQRIIKYLAVAFAIFLIVNIFYGIYKVGLFVGSAFFSTNSIGELKIDEFSDDAKILSIDVAATKLEIKKGDTLRVENNNKNISARQVSEKVEIKEKNHGFFGGVNNSVVTIYVPDDMEFDKVYISTGAGALSIEKLITDELDLELGAGRIVIDNLDVKEKCKINSGAGAVDIEHASIHDLDLNVGIGKFALNSILEGSSKIEAGVGELSINLLDDDDNYRIEASKGLGSLRIGGKSYGDEVNYGDGNNKIVVEGGIGSININFKG